MPSKLGAKYVLIKPDVLPPNNRLDVLPRPWTSS